MTKKPKVDEIGWADRGKLLTKMSDTLLGVLDSTEFLVLFYIWRRSVGFGKVDGDTISLGQLCEGIKSSTGERLDYGTGLHKTTVIRAIQHLLSLNILQQEKRAYRTGAAAPSLYRINWVEVDRISGLVASETMPIRGLAKPNGGSPQQLGSSSQLLPKTKSTKPVRKNSAAEPDSLGSSPELPGSSAERTVYSLTATGVVAEDYTHRDSTHRDSEHGDRKHRDRKSGDDTAPQSADADGAAQAVSPPSLASLPKTRTRRFDLEYLLAYSLDIQDWCQLHPSVAPKNSAYESLLVEIAELGNRDRFREFLESLEIAATKPIQKVEFFAFGFRNFMADRYAIAVPAPAERNGHAENLDVHGVLEAGGW